MIYLNCQGVTYEITLCMMSSRGLAIAQIKP